MSGRLAGCGHAPGNGRNARHNHLQLGEPSRVLTSVGILVRSCAEMHLAAFITHSMAASGLRRELTERPNVGADLP